MKLRDFARPPMDSGIGMHFDLDLRQSNLDQHIPLMHEMGVKWSVFYVGDELQARDCTKRAKAYGIMPIIRPQVKVLGQANWEGHVNAVLSVGFGGAYIQIGNEVGNQDEWQNHHYDLGQLISWWNSIAERVVTAGGYPGLQSMDKDETQAMLSASSPNVRDRLWFASHAYASNHPSDYPYDARNQQDHPGATIFDDDTCQLRFVEEAEWCKQVLGYYPPIIVTEGGCAMDQSEDNRYPRTDADLHEKYSVAIFNQFRGTLANGQPLPDYLFAYCPFILFSVDYYSFSWLQVAPKTIEAVKAMAPFVRKFSWDNVPIPPPPPPPPVPQPNPTQDWTALLRVIMDFILNLLKRR